MATLWWPLAALAALALLFVCYPLLRNSRSSVNVEQPQANTELFQEHLAELQQQYDRGDIDDNQFSALRAELERSLLAENQSPAEASTTKASKPLWLMVALVVLLPIVAIWTYQQLGASADLSIVEKLERSSQLQSRGDSGAAALRREVLAEIEQQLQQRPDNFYYWVLSGRLNTEQNQLPQALTAYRRADELSGGQDVTLMQEYLQVAFALQQPDSFAEMKSLADRILAKTPDNLPVLGLRGRLAYEEGDFLTAVRDWSKVLKVLPPQQATTAQIAAELEKARAQLTPEQHNELAKGQLRLAVQLAPELASPQGGTLFVIARPVGQTTGAPLAVQRIANPVFPLQVILDDSNLMLPGASLADMDEISVVARVSASGGVKAQPGDLQGNLGSVAVGNDSPVELVINNKL
ncbi:c-type cytochrome biogenesis protein CcmI [bacterium SCSIO 12696]|nr:c-type cytochrome biogenesis protein CcmI [bacterium SCSIO 12696]